MFVIKHKEIKEKSITYIVETIIDFKNLTEGTVIC